MSLFNQFSVKIRANFLKILFFFTVFTSYSQIQIDSMGVITKDTVYVIEEVFITNVKLTPEEIEARKQFILLKRRVLKTYPYARVASERLEVLNKNLAKLKSKKERKRFLKITEDYMENEFEARLKKLSKKEGQVLVKLINRQTGLTTYELVKDLKSSWSAYWYGKTAKLFDIDLKKGFSPYIEREDYLIEKILQQGFKEGMLIEQKPKVKLDYDKISEIWNDEILK